MAQNLALAPGLTAKVNGKSLHCLLDSDCERSVILGAWSLT